jgi:hypothetical protein
MAAETNPKAANLICLAEIIPIVDSHVAGPGQSTRLERLAEDDGNPDISTDRYHPPSREGRDIEGSTTNNPRNGNKLFPNGWD